jgi:hypothetical protein
MQRRLNGRTAADQRGTQRNGAGLVRIRFLGGYGRRRFCLSYRFGHGRHLACSRGLRLGRLLLLYGSRGRGARRRGRRNGLRGLDRFVVFHRRFG